MFFITLGTYTRWTFVIFSLVQRILLLIFPCHTVTHGTDLRRSPHLAGGCKLISGQSRRYQLHQLHVAGSGSKTGGIFVKSCFQIIFDTGLAATGSGFKIIFVFIVFYFSGYVRTWPFSSIRSVDHRNSFTLFLQTNNPTDNPQAKARVQRRKKCSKVDPKMR